MGKREHFIVDEEIVCPECGKTIHVKAKRHVISPAIPGTSEIVVTFEKVGAQSKLA